MAYQVLYRTYRPAKFSEVVGQEYIIKTLKNAIKTGRIAHAYLFAGPRGTGKTTIAKLFSRAVNCENFEEECCGTCHFCTSSTTNNDPDIIELDAASNNSVEDIRDIVEKVKYLPVSGKYKVYIIDEVHMLSNAAFNALLKTLEEPPKHVIFILATTDPQKIIPTVLSRVQRYNFSKISKADMVRKMKEICEAEHLEYEDKALEMVAVMAEGGMRDALSTLEQILSYNNEGIFLEDVQKIFGLSSVEDKVELLSMIHRHEISSAVVKLREMYQAGIDPKRLAVDLLEIIKETLLYADRGSSELLEVITAVEAQNIINVARPSILLKDVEHLQMILTKLRTTQNFISYLELCLIQMGGASDTAVAGETVVSRPAVSRTATTHVQVETAPVRSKFFDEEPAKPETDRSKLIKTESEPAGAVIKNENEQKSELKEPAETASEERSEVIEPAKAEMKTVERKELEPEFLLNVLFTATKENKINDEIIYNRLEMYKLEPAKRKFYMLLNGTQLYASGNDAIVILTNTVQAATINDPITNEDLFHFLDSEFGIQKMVYAIDDEMRNKLVTMYRNASPKQRAEGAKVYIPKYEAKKELTKVDKIKEIFGQCRVED